MFAGLAAVVGLLVGQWVARRAAVQISLPPYVDLTPDWRVVVATCAIALLVALAVGAAPAWIVTRRDLVTGMKDGGHQTSTGIARGRFRLFSIASQVAGCCVLLLVAGTTVRGLQSVLRANFGFEFDRIAVLDPSLPRYGIAAETAKAFWDETKRVLEATPGRGAACARVDARRWESAPTARSTTTLLACQSRRQLSNLEFFSVLRIPILMGRNFEADDAPDGVAIISRSSGSGQCTEP